MTIEVEGTSLVLETHNGAKQSLVHHDALLTEEALPDSIEIDDLAVGPLVKSVSRDTLKAAIKEAISLVDECIQELQSSKVRPSGSFKIELGLEISMEGKALIIKGAGKSQFKIVAEYKP